MRAEQIHNLMNTLLQTQGELLREVIAERERLKAENEALRGALTAVQKSAEGIVGRRAGRRPERSPGGVEGKGE